jgi:plasmid stabilization system protein ParE
MSVRVLPKARSDLREAIRHYRAIRPPAIGKQLAGRVLEAFKHAMASVEAMPLSRPEHPDIVGARWVQLERFPYVAFYTVKDGGVVVVAVEYATRDYVERVEERIRRGEHK